MDGKSVLEELSVLAAQSRAGFLINCYSTISFRASQLVRGTTSQEYLLENLRNTKACVWINPHISNNRRDKNNYDVCIKVGDSDPMIFPIRFNSSYESLETDFSQEIEALKSAAFDIDYRGYRKEKDLEEMTNIFEDSVDELEKKIEDGE